MPNLIHCGDKRHDRLPPPHQDEFPAAYSLAGCSPAEPTSASAAISILNQQLPFVYAFSANGNCPQTMLSHFVAQATAMYPLYPQDTAPNTRNGAEKFRHIPALI